MSKFDLSLHQENYKNNIEVGQESLNTKIHIYENKMVCSIRICDTHIDIYIKIHINVVCIKNNCYRISVKLLALKSMEPTIFEISII